nr:hypothetical protein [Tanacetum cinerariifolium]
MFVHIIFMNTRLRIEKSNFRLRLDITSKESTLQLVYDVLRLAPFYKEFLVIAYVSEIYMQEFWATATVHDHSIYFKMDNKKRIVNLEYFKEMMHICPRLPGQTFNDLPFEEEILAFLRFLGHSGEIRKLTDGMYHQKNVDFAYLLWEGFVYLVENKDAKKSTYKTTSANLSCSASVIATSESTVRLFALEALACCLPFPKVERLVPAAVGGVTIVSKLLFVFLTLALVFGGVAPDATV